MPRIAPFAALLAAAATCLPCAALPDDRAQGGLLADLPNLKSFRAGRSSSYDPTGGNADGRTDWPIQPSETRQIADIKGPGAITHIWITIASRDPNHLRNLVLRMYWDGEREPSVEAPIGDFFGLGHAQYYQYASLPIQIGVDKGLNCYWRMPFSKGARITVSNDGAVPVVAFYYYVDYEIHTRPTGGPARFHARYTQAYPCPKGANYVILEAVGRGHYVGCNLSIHNRADGWWGEGDDMIYVDGARTPTLHGTGSEDYFCGAWCYGESFVKPFGNPYFGNPLNDGGHTQNAKWNVYRYHIEDPIPFRRSIRVTMEHGHNNTRFDDFASVAYWYQTEPHAPFAPLPPASERMPTAATVYVEAYAIEVEDLAQAFGSPEVVEESTLAHGNAWSSGKHLAVHAAKPGTYTANVPTSASEAGTYPVDWWVTAGPNYGRCELWFNGERVCAWDGYNASGVIRRKIDIRGRITVKAKDNVLELRVTGKNDASSGYYAGIDCMKVIL